MAVITFLEGRRPARSLMDRLERAVKPEGKANAKGLGG